MLILDNHKRKNLAWVTRGFLEMAIVISENVFLKKSVMIKVPVHSSGQITEIEGHHVDEIVVNGCTRRCQWWQFINTTNVPLHKVSVPQEVFNPGHAQLHIQHCSYWCPGAKAPGHQHPHRWLNIHFIGPVSYRNIAVLRNNIRSLNNGMRCMSFYILRKNKITFWRKNTQLFKG